MAKHNQSSLSNTREVELFKGLGFSRKQLAEDLRIVECPLCENWHRIEIGCPYCSNWQDERIVKSQFSKTDARARRTVEIAVSGKKKSAYNIYSNFRTLVNRKKELLNFSIPYDNPDYVIINAKGGVHDVGFRMEIGELSELLKKAKIEHKLVTGKRYYRKTKRGRPKKRSIRDRWWEDKYG